MVLKTLTPRQERFVEEFLKDRNAAAAYRRAGYTGGRPQAKAVDVYNAPLVRDAIEAAEHDGLRDATADAARIVARYATIAFASIADFITIAPDGTLDCDARSIDPERLAALEVLDVSERPASAKQGGGRIRRIRIRLADKLEALDALGRQLGLFVARPEDRFRGRPAELRPLASPTEDSRDESDPPLFRGIGPTAARRTRFVAEYLRHGDATRAYIAAGYKSTPSAGRNAWKLSADRDIRAAIEAGQRRLARRFDVSAQRVLEEFAAVAFADVANFLDVADKGVVRLDLQYTQPAHLAALREIVVEQQIERTDGRAPVTRGFRLKLASKQHALDALARHRGLFRKAKPLTPEELGAMGW
jgi:phage terminase small subunit